MKKFYFFFLALILMSGAMAQWVPQNSGTTQNLHSVFFTETKTGYTVGDFGIILKTSDGINWTIQTSGTNQNLYSVFFTGPDTGYIAGDSSVLLKTVNGGIHWTFQNTVNPVNLTSIHFPSPDTGYAVGNYSPGGSSNNAYVLKTTNGGQLWSTIDTMLSGGGTGFYNPYLLSAFFTNVNVGYKVGTVASMDGPHGLIGKTTNGGFDWSSVTGTPSYCRSMTSVYFIGADTGYVTGNFLGPNWNDPHNIKTTDAGNSWTSQNIGVPWISRSVYFIDVDTGYVVGGTSIAKTLNGGTDWSYQTSGTSNELNSVYFIDADTGYIVGDNGTILKTTNGGSFPVGVNDKHPAPQDLKIYPNPSSDKITIETAVEGQLSIKNLNGQELLNQPILKPSTEIDIVNLPVGVYFMRFTNKNTVQMGKFIKQ